MGLFDSLAKAAKLFVDDMNTPESFKKGEKFEKFTREVIFPEDRYVLKKMTHSYSQNKKDYVDDSKEPDFKFECKETKRVFYVEAKYRSYFFKENERAKPQIQFCKQYQYDRYKEIDKETPVFICIGLGDDPFYPELVCLIPMRDIAGIYLYESFLEIYLIPDNREIAPKRLWSLIENKKAEPRNMERKIPEKTFEKEKSGSGHCIRCKASLPLNPEHPLCKKCYGEWSKYKNPDYHEKYCHACGKDGETSVAKPVCYSCYKKLR